MASSRLMYNGETYYLVGDEHSSKSEAQRLEDTYKQKGCKTKIMSESQNAKLYYYVYVNDAYQAIANL